MVLLAILGKMIKGSFSLSFWLMVIDSYTQNCRDSLLETDAQRSAPAHQVPQYMILKKHGSSRSGRCEIHHRSKWLSHKIMRPGQRLGPKLNSNRVQSPLNAQRRPLTATFGDCLSSTGITVILIPRCLFLRRWAQRQMGTSKDKWALFL